MKMRPIDFAILDEVNVAMVSITKNKQQFTWNQIASLREAGWEHVNLVKEMISANWVCIHYSVTAKALPLIPTNGKWVDLDSLNRPLGKVKFKVEIPRSHWRKHVEAQKTLSEETQSQPEEHKRPSYKDHPVFKKSIQRPVGRFMRPINKQASNLFKRGD